MLAMQSIRGLLTSAANTNGSTLGDTAAVGEVDCANNMRGQQQLCQKFMLTDCYQGVPGAVK